MPTYRVTYINLDLSDDQRQAIANSITEAHSRNTGAPGYFAQIIFETVAAGRHFIGGRPNTIPHIYVHGWIRDGRTYEQKSALMDEICARVCEAGNVGREDVWVYLQDIFPRQMVEFGRTLPEPGDETQWQRGFSPGKLEDFEKTGVKV